MNPTSTPPSARVPWPRVLAFVSVAVLLLLGLSAVFDFAARRDLRVKARWILAQRGGSYDFAVLGPSRSYVGVDIGLLEKRLGGRAINLSLDGAGTAEQLLALRCFLRANAVRHLLLEANLSGWDPAALKYPFHDYDYLPFQGEPAIDAALREERGLKALAWKYVPFWKNAEFNAQMGPIQLYTWAKAARDPRARVAEFDAHGSRLSQAPFTLRGNTAPVRWQTDPRLVASYLKLIDFAQQENPRVTLILTPEWRPYSRLQVNRQELLDRQRDIARERGLPFLVFDDLPWLEDSAYFSDPNHLNRTGAARFTEELASRLQTPVAAAD